MTFVSVCELGVFPQTCPQFVCAITVTAYAQLNVPCAHILCMLLHTGMYFYLPILPPCISMVSTEIITYSMSINKNKIGLLEFGLKKMVKCVVIFLEVTKKVQIKTVILIKPYTILDLNRSYPKLIGKILTDFISLY